MKHKALGVVAAVLLCGITARPAQALLGFGVTLNFSMPAGADPFKLTYTQANTPYLKDDNGNNLTGNLFMNTPNGGATGLELHGLLPTNPGHSDNPVYDVEFVTTYLGVFNPPNITANGSGYADWIFQDLGVDPTTGLRHFRFYAPTSTVVTGAPMDDRINGAFFGLLSADDVTDPTFAHSLFATQGFPDMVDSGPGNPPAPFLLTGNPFGASIPELSTVATFGSLLAAGGVSLVRRRRRPSA